MLYEISGLNEASTKFAGKLTNNGAKLILHLIKKPKDYSKKLKNKVSLQLEKLLPLTASDFLS